jgi:hypothetical protein
VFVNEYKRLEGQHKGRSAMAFIRQLLKNR